MSPGTAVAIASRSEQSTVHSPSLSSLVLLTVTTGLVIFSVHPNPILPLSPLASSTTYRLHVPSGLVPLKTLRFAAPPGEGSVPGPGVNTSLSVP